MRERVRLGCQHDPSLDPSPDVQQGDNPGYKKYDTGPDVYDTVVRFLRPCQSTPRCEGDRLRGDQPRRRPRLSHKAPRADRELDCAADPDRRAADRRLHRALAARPRRPARRAARRLRRRLAARAVPRAPARNADLLDQRSAPWTRLAGAAVDLELRLHPAGASVRKPVVGQGRPLSRDPDLERASHAAVKGAHLLAREVAGAAQGMDAGPPERLIRVDVAYSGYSALIEESCLDRRAPIGEAAAEVARPEVVVEGLVADPRIHVRRHIGRLEHEPRPEPAHVSIGNVRPVV